MGAELGGGREKSRCCCWLKFVPQLCRAGAGTFTTTQGIAFWCLLRLIFGLEFNTRAGQCAMVTTPFPRNINIGNQTKTRTGEKERHPVPLLPCFLGPKLNVSYSLALNNEHDENKFDRIPSQPGPLARSRREERKTDLPRPTVVHVLSV